jgi:hypothetical protein
MLNIRVIRSTSSSTLLTTVLAVLGPGKVAGRGLPACFSKTIDADELVLAVF